MAQYSPKTNTPTIIMRIITTAHSNFLDAQKVKAQHLLDNDHFKYAFVNHFGRSHVFSLKFRQKWIGVWSP